MAPPARLAAICAALPEAVRRPARDDPALRVRGTPLALLVALGGRPSFRVDVPSVRGNVPEGSRDILLGADPGRVPAPLFAGHRHCAGVRLGGDPDRDDVRTLVIRSSALVAPGRLLRTLQEKAP
ncbi:phosphoribosylglycinamide formyltransferase [Acuticoccus sediminis]|uniref:Phosphoribosylglycinamide formyltransferase n=1 Tax=Acuticoccus sediminis TaxID=2184697 RepID=A0A8B2NP19_9HYPH|nr:MmcQ/YjbR family DNA-binding protein [Acuticoccus sediminis]RAI00432.1 phosphoribosylglycinamide formyltransferase [Acuticoccus sediminis]